MKKGSTALNRWIVLLIYILGVLSFTVVSNAMSPLALVIQEEMGIGIGEYSRLATAPTLAALALSLVAGAMSDRIGQGRAILLGLTLGAIGLIMRMFVHTYLPMFALMLLIGVGNAFLNANSSKVTNSWFDAGERKRAIGFALAATPCGMTIGLAVGGMFTSVRHMYAFNAAIMVVPLILWVFFALRRKPPCEEPSQKTGDGQLQGLGLVLKNRFMRLAGGSVICVMSCCTIMTVFFPSVLQYERDVDILYSGTITAFFSCGNILGTVAGPMLAPSGKRYKPTLLIAGVIVGVGCALAHYLPVNIVMMLVLLATGTAMGVLVSQLMGSPVLRADVPSNCIGTAGGLLSTCQMFGAFFVASYIIVPLSKGNYNVMFNLCGGVIALMCVLIAMMPKPAEADHAKIQCS